MPYMKVKQDDQICIYKHNGDNQPIGESLGCHPTEAAADEQLAALYASENMTVQLPADDTLLDTRHFMGGVVRAVGDGIVEGYLVPFNGPDNPDFYDTYFNQHTNYMFDDYPILRAFMLYNHGLDETMSVRTLGKFLRAKIDDVGLWVQAQLELRDEWEQEVYKLAQNGKLGWSSGALPQAVEVEEDGHVKTWPIIEGSLTPQPAAVPFASQIYTRRSYQDALQRATDGLARKEPAKQPVEIQSTNRKHQPKQERQSMAEHDATRNLAEVAQMVQQVLNMLMEYVNAEAGEGGEPMPAAAQEDMMTQLQNQMTAKLDEMQEQIQEWTPDKMRSWLEEQAIALLPSVVDKYHKDRAAREQQMRAAAKNAFKQVEPTPAPGFVGGNGNGRITGGNNLRFAHLSAAEMCLAVQMRTAPLRQQGINMPLDTLFSQDFLDNLRGKVGEEISGKPFGDNAKGNATLRSIVPFRADEQDATAISTQGAEWVGDYWSTTLWEKERYPRMFDLLVQKGMMVEDIPQGTDSANFPTEGSDPTAYVTPEGRSTDATGAPETVVNINPFTTGKVTLTPKEITLASSVTVIADEDWVIRAAPQVSRQLEEAFLETRDKVIINADTETAASTNINLIDSTPGTGLQTPYYLACNGFRKLPLVTYTTGSRDAANDLDLSDYRATLALLDGELRQYKERCLYIIDPDTEMASLAIPELLTISERPAQYASIEAGELRKVFKIDVFTSGFLYESNSSGKISATASNNTQGTILLVYAPYWGFGYKRQMTLETEYSALWKSTVYVMSGRYGVIARGTNASVLSYNVNNA